MLAMTVKMSAKHLRVGDVAAFTHDEGIEDFSGIFCGLEQDYVVSLSRFPDDHLIEVMVVDQIVHGTKDVSAELYQNKLVIRISKEAAQQLDNITEYILLLEVTQSRLLEIHRVLKVIFDGVGHYEAKFT
jgi:hypothetical protein